MRVFLVVLLCCFLSLNGFADRIYVMNSSGYNTADPELIEAIEANGHTVEVNDFDFSSLPDGFTSTCNDPEAGYDWLCFFGNEDFSSLSAEILAFINEGGKVYYQYEVSCCVTSSTAVANILSDVTGLDITPNANEYIALGFIGGGYEAENLGCCATFTGNAYKSLDGLPLENQLQATETLGGGAPPVETSPNLGFQFATDDFVGTANAGGMIGLGDINLFYDAQEPPNNFGSSPVNPAIIDFLFPDETSTCFAFPPGCLTEYVGSSIASVDLGTDTTLCPGETFILDVTQAGASYLWQDDSTNPTFTVNGPGEYWVELSTLCGMASDTIQVELGEIPEINLGSDIELCQGQSAELDATTPGVTYLWQDNSTSPILEVNQSGTYWVELTNGCGSQSDSLVVTVYPLPAPSLDDAVLCEGEAVTLNAFTPGATYLWQDNSTGATLLVTEEGTYSVEVTVNNCTGSASAEVFLEDCSVVLIMPNVFTPGNDGLNDLFSPIQIQGVAQLETSIYNRWGNLVYVSSDLLISWDARDVSEGTYYWVANYTDIHGEEHSQQGHVTVIH